MPPVAVHRDGDDLAAAARFSASPADTRDESATSSPPPSAHRPQATRRTESRGKSCRPNTARVSPLPRPSQKPGPTVFWPHGTPFFVGMMNSRHSIDLNAPAKPDFSFFAYLQATSPTAPPTTSPTAPTTTNATTPTQFSDFSKFFNPFSRNALRHKNANFPHDFGRFANRPRLTQPIPGLPFTRRVQDARRNEAGGRASVSRGPLAETGGRVAGGGSPGRFGVGSGEAPHVMLGCATFELVPLPD